MWWQMKAAGLSFEAPGGRPISQNTPVRARSINTLKLFSHLSHWTLKSYNLTSLCASYLTMKRWSLFVGINSNGIRSSEYRKLCIADFYERAAQNFFPFLNISKSSIIQFVSLMASPLSMEASPHPRPPPFSFICATLSDCQRGPLKVEHCCINTMHKQSCFLLRLQFFLSPATVTWHGAAEPSDCDKLGLEMTK